MMRRRAGNVCMGLGAVLVLAALSLFLLNRQEDRQAGASVEKILPQLFARIEALQTGETSEAPAYPDPYDPAMTEVEIDGYAYIGYLSIPSLELELPVMSEWDYTRLKISPCRYAGSTKTDDLVICGHNYSRHLGPIRGLVPGDLVYFTDMDGVVWEYQVESVDTLRPTEIETMTAGTYDLTLFTCDYSTRKRVAVRCECIGSGSVT